MAYLCQLLLLWSAMQTVSAYPNGAPTGACTSMVPQHGTQPQSTESPYSITLEVDKVVSQSAVTVTIQGDGVTDIRGILLQAREANSETIVGAFIGLESDGDFKGIDCNGVSSAVTHSNRDDKSLPVQFTWMAPQTTDPIAVEFVATVVQSTSMFWTGIKSKTIMVLYCSVDNLSQIATCALDFSQGIQDASSQLLISQEINSTMFCSSIEGHYNDLNSCTGSLSDGCKDLSNFSEIEDSYQQLTSQYCGSGCNKLELSLCVQNLGTEIQQALADQSTGDICGKISDTLKSTHACLDAFQAECSTDEAYISSKQSLQNFEATYCAGETCGIGGLYYCMQLYPANSSFPAICGGFQNMSQCFEAYKERCGEVDLDEALSQKGFEANLQSALDLCDASDECPDYNDKITTLSTCVSNVNVPSVTSFDNMCGYVQSVGECLIAQTDCHLVASLLAPAFAQLRLTAAMFDCEITLGNNIFAAKSSDCNLYSMVQCVSPILPSLSLPDFDKTTDLQEYYTTISGLSLNVEEVSSESDICRAVSDAGGVDCYITEYNKCPFLTTGVSTIQVFVGLQGVVPLPNTLSLDYIQNAMMPVNMLISGFDRLIAPLEMRCTESCDDLVTRQVQFVQCIAPYGFTQNFIDELGSSIKGLIQKYTADQNYESDCRSLQGAMTCAESHFVGCPFTESSINTFLSNPAVYQFLEICSIESSFQVKDVAIGCSRIDFVEVVETGVNSHCVSAVTYTGIQTIPDDYVCSSFEADLECANSWSSCCQIKQKTIVPKLHTAALLNDQFPSCDIRMPDGGIQVTANENCNYMEVLRCYLPLLRMVGLDTLDSLNKSKLASIVSLKDIFTKENCTGVSESEFEGIQSCLEEKSGACTFPAICNADQSDSSPLPLDDLIGYTKISNMCKAECLSVDDNPSSCVTPMTSVAFLQVASSDLTGLDTEGDCEKLESLMNCVETEVGDCRVGIMEARSYLSWESPTFSQVVDKCDLDVGFLTEVTDGPINPSSTVVTIGAAGLRVEMTVLILSMTFYIIFRILY